jgi:hypothetical protein
MDDRSFAGLASFVVFMDKQKRGQATKKRSRLPAGGPGRCAFKCADRVAEWFTLVAV